MKLTIGKSRGRSFLFGVGFVAVVGVILSVSFTAQSGPPLTHRTQIKAAFLDVGQLTDGDDVRENSVRVGQVTDIEYSGNQAIVTMQLEQNGNVYADATAAMWDVNALGQKFVELDPGSAASGPLGNTTIPTSRTESSADIDQLLDVLDPQTRQATQTVVRELGTGVAGRSAELHAFLQQAPAMVTDFGSISSALASPNADLPALLASAQRLSAQLAGQTGQLGQLLRNTTTTLQAVNVDGAKPLSDVVAELPGTLSDVRTVAAALRQPLANAQSALTTLGPGAQSLGQATPDLRSFLTGSLGALDKVPGVATAAGPAVTELTKTLSYASPVVPRLDQALASLNPFLTALAPYSVDVAAVANGGASFTNGRFYDQQGLVYGYVHIFPVVSLGSVAGLVPQGYDPYPLPGTAQLDGSGRSPNPSGGKR
jgi:phospholipid/cholesterol/gamma-HCH transport system substrate-binding protein